MKSDIKEAIDKAGIKDEKIIEKLLKIHGEDLEKEGNLSGALNLLSEKYIGEFHDFSRPEADEVAGSGRRKAKQSSIPRRRVMSFINKRTHKARQLRNKRRVQHVRDNLEGQIAAYEDVLRYIKKIK